jgi:SAM-dependent methyltransferase
LDNWDKVQLSGVLAASLDLDSYLEITTTGTGGKYRQARDLSFKTCMRLVYRIGAWAVQDGLPVDFPAQTEDISAPLADIRQKGLTFDLVFLDAHHTYECAARDLAAAYSLLTPRGVMVIHDCNPPSREIASPEQVGGAWCGATYKSFIDFCLGNPSIDYFTVDADYGCGVIIKPRDPDRALQNIVRARREKGLLSRWSGATTDFDAAYTLFEANREALLHLTDFGGLRARISAGR